MRITKVKLSGERVLIEYEKPGHEESWDKFTTDCSEAPQPSFNQKLQSLKQYVLDLCEFPASQIDRFKVMGVSFSYKGDEGIMGAIVTAQKRVKGADSPMIINTPHLSSKRYAKANSSTPILSSAVVKILDELKVEAIQYLDGIRSQLTIFPSPEKAEGSGKGKLPRAKTRKDKW